MSGFSYGTLMISDSQLFCLTLAEFSYHLTFIKFTALISKPNEYCTVGSISSDWANQISCGASSCNFKYSESLLNIDKSTIYSLFIYELPLLNLYFSSFSTSTGEVVGTNYISSIECDSVNDSVLKDNNIIAVAMCSSTPYLILYNTATSNFSFYKYTGNALYGLGIESSTGRVMIVGETQGGYGYTIKSVYSMLVCILFCQILAC